MRQKRIDYLTSLLVLIVGFMGFQSCDEKNKPTPPVVEEVLSITPKEASIKVGETLVVKVLLDKKEVTAEAFFSTTPEEIISISKEGTVIAIKAGKATLKATYNGKQAEAVITVTEKEEEKPQEEWVMPYLRWFDSAEELIAFETKRGNVLKQKDEALQYYAFQTKSQKMPLIKYIVGRSIQIDITPELSKSEELKAFLEKNGFTYADNDWSKKYMILNSKYKTVIGFIYSEYPEYGTFFGFNRKNPTFESLPLPLLDWNASEDVIKTFEEKAGRKFLERRKDNSGRDEIIYGLQKEGEEYEEIFIARYTIKDGKLIKVLLQVTPANYIIEPMDNAFSVVPEFESYVKGLGYTISTVEGKNLNVYTNKEKGNKFTLGQWNIKMKNGRRRVFASMNFVPSDGPDVID